jgi:hypothetical protein
MQPSLQAALFTGVGLKRAESTFTASDLLIPSSGVTVLGNVWLRTLPALRGSKSRRVAPLSTHPPQPRPHRRLWKKKNKNRRATSMTAAQLAAESLSQPHAEEFRDPV